MKPIKIALSDDQELFIRPGHQVEFPAGLAIEILLQCTLLISPTVVVDGGALGHCLQQGRMEIGHRAPQPGQLRTLLKAAKSRILDDQPGSGRHPVIRLRIPGRIEARACRGASSNRFG